MKRAVFIVAGLVSALYATAPMRPGGYPRPPRPVPLAQDTIDPLDLRFNYLYEFAQIAQFCVDWQLDDPDSAEHGGMIEAESGDLWDVIQTDNTQEAIWVWCRYGELTGDTARFRENIEKAWFYCENFPAWKEEGNMGDDYYRDHNCAWGVAAEQRYRAVYGDDSYEWYRDSCADYMMHHPLNILTKTTASSPAGVRDGCIPTGWRPAIPKPATPPVRAPTRSSQESRPHRSSSSPRRAGRCPREPWSGAYATPPFSATP